MKWLDERGCQMAGPPWEVYLIGPDDQPDPTRWLTQIVAPCQVPPPEPESAKVTIFGADGRHEQLL
jgi:hypothetical protein